MSDYGMSPALLAVREAAVELARQETRTTAARTARDHALIAARDAGVRPADIARTAGLARSALYKIFNTSQ